MVHRSLLLLALVVIASACTAADDSAATSSTDAPTSTSTTTTPPVILGLGPNLALAVDQCWSALLDDAATTTSDPAPPTTTTSTVPTTAAVETADTTEPPERITTVPRPNFVAVVDCAGSHDGVVYATFCLGPGATRADRSIIAQSCALPSALDWPGDRAVRRAAVRECLTRFEELFGEAYADSDLVAREFTPTEGVWNTGDRRVVCGLDATITTPSG